MQSTLITLVDGSIALHSVPTCKKKECLSDFKFQQTPLIYFLNLHCLIHHLYLSRTRNRLNLYIWGLFVKRFFCVHFKDKYQFSQRTTFYLLFLNYLKSFHQFHFSLNYSTITIFRFLFFPRKIISWSSS